MIDTMSAVDLVTTGWPPNSVANNFVEDNELFLSILIFPHWERQGRDLIPHRSIKVMLYEV